MADGETCQLSRDLERMTRRRGRLTTIQADARGAEVRDALIRHVRHGLGLGERILPRCLDVEPGEALRGDPEGAGIDQGLEVHRAVVPRHGQHEQPVDLGGQAALPVPGLPPRRGHRDHDVAEHLGVQRGPRPLELGEGEDIGGPVDAAPAAVERAHRAVADEQDRELGPRAAQPLERELREGRDAHGADAGRALAVATDGSWRWGFLAAETGQGNRAYQRFWNSALRWLVKDPALAPLQVEPDAPAVEPGARVSGS